MLRIWAIQINTPWDDIFYYPSPVNDSTFYFASNRSGGLGGLDIYKGKILPPKPVFIPPPPVKHDTLVIRDTVLIATPPAPLALVIKQESTVFLVGRLKILKPGIRYFQRLI